MDDISRDQWREFHYGKKQPKTASKFNTWTLTYNGNKLVTGGYALCVWKMKQVIANESCQRKLFKITGNE